ncbi:hypothetical protein ACVNPX_10355 [Staphylococcus aureus]
MAQYEIEIFSLCEKNPILSKNKSEKRFVATISFDDGREWPKYFKNLQMIKLNTMSKD